MKTIFSKDIAAGKMTVTREFAGTVEHVWQAWTDSELLDEWWAPKPWRTQTKSMNFQNGGYWLYSMNGPAGEKTWAKLSYDNIEEYKSLEVTGSFCDENGTDTTEAPTMFWKIYFHPSTAGTKIELFINFKSADDMTKMVEMGFETGFAMAHENLDQYLRAAFNLRRELRSNESSRVTTYLNFPGTTEEAFNFYKSIFKTAFSGKGIQRFSDIPAEAGHPPVADNVKKMVLHVELPILGGHILMGTDAPNEMGFTLNRGNNMHICLEPSTRLETKRLFDALSAGGSVTMPLADMFFGAYFGECVDKFGINWMFNCVAKK